MSSLPRSVPASGRRCQRTAGSSPPCCSSSWWRSPLRAAAAASTSPSDIAVAVHRDGETIVVDVNLVVRASPREVWDVLTDYDHMARFVSSLSMSRVLSHSEGRLLVAQTSRFRFGLMTLKFNGVRDIELIPLREIRSKLVRGDMKASAFTTYLVQEDGATRIINHARFIPGSLDSASDWARRFEDRNPEVIQRPSRPR